MSHSSISNQPSPGGTATTVFHRVAYTRCSSEQFPGPECLGYIMGKTLGSGTYAKVKAAYSREERRMIAVKILNKIAASKEYLNKFLPREVKVMQELRHPNIIQLYSLVETEKQMFFMLELAHNGDLLDYINAKRALKEKDARYIFKQMAGAIAYCHSKEIIHRDLKCENILLSATMQVKIGDFGFALNLADSAAKTPCGSYSYAAPELFTSNGEPYDGKKADVWSLGVILFAMVCGRLPFGDDAQIKKTQHRQLVFSRQLSPGFYFDDLYLQKLGECVTFINSLLNLNVKERLDSTGMLIAEWVMADNSNTPPAQAHSSPKYTLGNCIPQIQQTQMVVPLPPHSYVITPVPVCMLPPHRNPAPVAVTQVIGAPIHVSVPPPPPPLTLHSTPVVHVAIDTTPQAQTVMTHRRIDMTVTPQIDSQAERVRSGQRPIVAKIGAYGRKIADAVKHVGHHKHTASNSSSSSSK